MIKPPKLSIEPLQPVALEIVDKLTATCVGKALLTLRDKALLLMLLDTRARASEVCALDVDDIDLISGAISINCVKGRKSRVVILGQTSRRALRSYLKARMGNLIKTDRLPCWITKDGYRLTIGV
jgi:site-specific recombinase XerD